MEIDREYDPEGDKAIGELRAIKTALEEGLPKEVLDRLGHAELIIAVLKRTDELVGVLSKVDGLFAGESADAGETECVADYIAWLYCASMMTASYITGTESSRETATTLYSHLLKQACTIDDEAEQARSER